MSKRPRVLRSHRKIIGPMSEVNPNAAGIDAGSREHWVSVPEDRAEESVRKFGVFTEELQEIGDWLVECGITTVAIEATGVYWIPLFEILEARGLEVKLVDSRCIGRRNKKTDVLDCQWIRQLHMYGLLDPAFRPNEQIMPLRGYMRLRRMLIGYASDHIRHMQKALDLMNLKLHLVIDDITGVTGLAIIGAILKGERDPAVLAAMRDGRCKKSEETIAKALMGNFREEHLFALQVAFDLLKTYQSRIAECDSRLQDVLEDFESTAPKFSLPETKEPTKRKRRKNQPHFDARALLAQMAGVDLIAVDGFEASTVLTLVSETGVDMSHWPTEGHFCSWLALCTNTRVTGGKPIRKKGPKLQPNRAAQAFRLAAQSTARSKTATGAFFRRMQYRGGWEHAVKATAHRLARIYYAMLKNKTPYAAPEVNYYEKRYRQNLLKSLEKNALALGFTLTPISVPPESAPDLLTISSQSPEVTH